MITYQVVAFLPAGDWPFTMVVSFVCAKIKVEMYRGCEGIKNIMISKNLRTH
jgi:hypothetical protein